MKASGSVECVWDNNLVNYNLLQFSTSRPFWRGKVAEIEASSEILNWPDSEVPLRVNSTHAKKQDEVRSRYPHSWLSTGSKYVNAPYYSPLHLPPPLGGLVNARHRLKCRGWRSISLVSETGSISVISSHPASLNHYTHSMLQGLLGDTTPTSCWPLGVSMWDLDGDYTLNIYLCYFNSRLTWAPYHLSQIMLV